jgi:exopolysaccharide biosynthesis protein
MQKHKPGTDSADGSGQSSRRTRPSAGKKGKGSRKGGSSSDSSGSSDSSKGKTQNSDNTQTNDNAQSNETIQKTLTDTSYSDGKISVQINTVRSNDTTVYIADVQLSSAAYLKTALAQNAFGRNVTEKTSAIASDHNAILAINGDYYGANSQGYVIKNGVLYRDTVRKSSDSEDLVIYRDGSFGIINEKDVTAQQLLDSGVYNLLSFGPALVQNGKVTVSENDEVGRAMADNPRTAIGIIDDLHYILVVSDGRTNESEGLSLYQLAQLMQQYGCKTAYNLDGGGSSTMVFNGQVVNNPTTNGNRISERAVSDIVYIGY